MDTRKIGWIPATLAAALAVFTLATPAQAQVGVYIGTPPPPMRYEVRPAAPGPGYGWIDGYWQPYNGRYRWIGGRWDRAPYEGAYWSHPHYDHYDRGWALHEGHWDHEDHGGRGYDHGDRHFDEHRR